MEVVRFGKLSFLFSAKSFPFRETLSDCKDTKIYQNDFTLNKDFFAKNS